MGFGVPEGGTRCPGRERAGHGPPPARLRPAGHRFSRSSSGTAAVEVEGDHRARSIDAWTMVAPKGVARDYRTALSARDLVTCSRVATPPLVCEQRVAAAVHPLPGRIARASCTVDASRRMPTRSISRYEAVLAAKQLAVTREDPGPGSRSGGRLARPIGSRSPSRSPRGLSHQPKSRPAPHVPGDSIVAGTQASPILIMRSPMITPSRSRISRRSSRSRGEPVRGSPPVGTVPASETEGRLR